MEELIQNFQNIHMWIFICHLRRHDVTCLNKNILKIAFEQQKLFYIIMVTLSFDKIKDLFSSYTL